MTLTNSESIVKKYSSWKYASISCELDNLKSDDFVDLSDATVIHV